jgi:hypothetical protein
MPNDDWSHEETDDPLHADRRNFYKVEKWSRDGQRMRNCCSLGTLKSRSSQVVGGIAENIDDAIRASVGGRRRAKYGFRILCGLAFFLQLRANVGAQDGHWSA